MNPLIPILAGFGLVMLGLKQLSGQDEKNSESTLTDSNKRAKVTPDSEKNSRIETETEIIKESDNGDTVESDSNSNDGVGSGNIDN